MTTDGHSSLIELLACSTAFTLCLVAFAIRWDTALLVELGFHGGMRLLFIPAFLISTYAGLRWFGVDTATSRSGWRPSTLWGIAAYFLAVLLAPATQADKLWFVCWTGVAVAVVWWIRVQSAAVSQRARQIADAKMIERRHP